MGELDKYNNVPYMSYLEKVRREGEQFEIEERRHQESLKTSKMSMRIAILALIVAVIGIVISLLK